jgi:hypothetical protein
MSFFAFVLSRALLLGFTHDESFSYLNFVDGASLSHILFHPFPAANNHYLNTVLMKISASLLGVTEFSLRIHSVLAFAIFLLAAFWIVRDLCAPRHLVLAFLLLNLNPFLLEYFSLARGYAAGLALMMVSILFLLRALDPIYPGPRSALICLSTGAMAALANLTFLYFYVSAATVLLAVSFRGDGQSAHDLCPIRVSRPARIQILWILAVSVLLFAAILPMAMQLRQRKEFYFGGERGFFTDTVISLVNASLYDHPVPQGLEDFLKVLVGMVAACTTAAIMVLSKKSALGNRSQKYLCLPAILLGAAFGTAIQRHLFGTRFLIDRTGILFVPLFVLVCIAGVEAAARSWPRSVVRMVALSFLVLLNVAAAANFARAANLRYTVNWRYDVETGQMLKDLAAREAGQNHVAPIRMGVTWYLEPSVNFYRTVRNLSWLERVTRAGITESDYDYYYVGIEDAVLLASTKTELIKSYEFSRTLLFKNMRSR